MRRHSTWVRRYDLTSKTSPRLLEAPQANLWALALKTASRLSQFYPTFYAEHVAGRPATAANLVRLCESFLRLVDREVPLLELWSLPRDPLAHLLEDDERSIADLDDIADALHQPQPDYYGIGVQEYFDEDEMGAGGAPSLLTLALWRLCDRTEWGVGVDARLGTDTTDGRLLAALRPLPAAADMVQICAHVSARAIGATGAQIPGGVGELIAYAFSNTDCELANYSDGEIANGNGRWLTWNDLPTLRAEVPIAQLIASVYGRWESRVEADPARELKRLEQALHGAARALKVPYTLLDSLSLDLDYDLQGKGTEGYGHLIPQR